MNKSFSIIILLAVFIGLTSCLKENCGCEPDNQPPVLFQYEYYNYAWGFRHHGFLIDSAGNIQGFRQPQKWMEPDTDGMMTDAALAFNLDQCDTICGKTKLTEMNLYYSSINDIRLKSKIIDHGMVMADAGTGVLSAWSWNKEAGKYESVFLISNGDLFRENRHPDVKKIIDWLKEIGEKTDRYFWYEGK